MELIDSHCHLEEIENLGDAVKRAREAGLIAIVGVGSDYESNNRVLEISEEYRGFVFSALGIHPGNLETSSERALNFIGDNLESAVAVGEVGLDYHKRVLARSSKDVQKGVFREVLSIARERQKPLIVHSRYAWRDCLTLVEEAGTEKAVFHWFTGPSSVIRDIVRLGYLISGTPAAEYHQEHRRAVKSVALDKLLLETDSPVSYGTETRWKAEPADLLRSLRAAAEARGVSADDLARATTDNAIELFRLPLRVKGGAHGSQVL